MEGDNNKYKSSWTGAIAGVVGIPWFELAGTLWKIGRKLMRGLSNEGVYEVLDYECTLELKDKNGMHATIQKRERVRYLQDYVTTYQDQAWGDGEILLNYRCSPGIPVDEYRLGHKTFKLISLREFRNRGDIDEFNVEWNMHNSFQSKTGYWGTAINHRMKKVTVRIIFPKDRPPLHVAITESNIRRTKPVEGHAFQKSPDGYLMVVWQITNPRLHENYVLVWEW